MKGPQVDGALGFFVQFLFSIPLGWKNKESNHRACPLHPASLLIHPEINMRHSPTSLFISSLEDGIGRQPSP